MEETPEPEAADPEPAYRHVFEKRAAAWAEGRGLISLLSSLETFCPHTFTLAAAEVGEGAPRPWVPTDATDEHEVKLAYRRASRLLHPDRLSQRDLSVRLEAEEVLKVLTTAFSAKAEWRKEVAVTVVQTHGMPAKSEPAAATSNVDIRNNIFGKTATKPVAPASSGGGWMPPPPPTAGAPGSTASTSTAGGGPAAGGTDLRDNIFAGAFDAKPGPSIGGAVRNNHFFGGGSSASGAGGARGSGTPFDEQPSMSRAGSYSAPSAEAPASGSRGASQSMPSTTSSSPFDEPPGGAAQFPNPFGTTTSCDHKATSGTSTVSHASLSAAAALFSEASGRSDSQRSDSMDGVAPSSGENGASRPQSTNPFGPASGGNPFG